MLTQPGMTMCCRVRSNPPLPRLVAFRFISRPSPSKQKLQRGQGSNPPSPHPEPSRCPSPTKLVISRIIPPKPRRMIPTKFRRPSPPKLRKLTFAVLSAFSRTKPTTTLLSCMPVNGAYNDLYDMDGKYAAYLDPLASVLSRTTSTGMTNPVSNKVPQWKNTKAEAKERQHNQEAQKEHNNSSRSNVTLKDRRRKNQQGGMKGCLTVKMAPRGARGHNDAILIDDDNNGNSASEQGISDTNMVDLKKDLSFIITRYKARGAPSLKDEGCAGSSQADLRPIHEVSSDNLDGLTLKSKGKIENEELVHFDGWPSPALSLYMQILSMFEIKIFRLII